MDVVYDFLEGRITYQVFISQLYSNNAIFEWLQSMVTTEAIEDEAFRCSNALERCNGCVKSHIDNTLDMRKITGGIMAMVSIYDFLYNFIIYFLPDKSIDKIEYYSNLARIYDAAVAECYGGPEVEELINNVILDLPDDLSPTKKIKLARQKIKDLFPGKRPFWIEYPDWPVSNGKPMVYLSKKVDGDLFMYTFEDPETGERRIVKQFA